ncbi:hypothetical protein B0H16DRAFT_1801604 [Mycena metata]|uniref:CxC2-like cysteine cluster KDZ transposase-associated domain-containing protein n=1 Tax=Mycena metata TaxID=1033252 RepID=A0AAD7HB26_9AGAR|nr:hypothetical protein B0H16DRAFT_1801604 [Mycena metata]
MAPSVAKSKGKRKATHLDSEDSQSNHVVFAAPALKRVNYTVTTDAGSKKSMPVIQRLPSKFTPLPKASTSLESEPQPPESEPEVKVKTQKAQLLEDFGGHFSELGRLLLDFEADERQGSPCSCDRPGMVATAQCHDCTGYEIACSTCFVDSHLRNPFHWAEIWDETQGFFVRHDISILGHVIHLGHNGRPCPHPWGEQLFTIVDDNGVHSTRLAFCGCHQLPPNKVEQLMRARLFPATTRHPQTAFTFRMLKGFQLHNLESKKAAYDYLGAIRRLTDNSFTAEVANPYAAFLCVVRVFNFLTLKKRAGQFHGIDLLLPHRPSGNLLVWCPACPEPGFNSDPNCPETPHHLRHVNQSQRTLDGNFQCNQFSKNTDPNDVSLCEGKGYFPLDSKYKEYLASIPVSKEKSTCNYLKAVNKQDKKKFKNMAVTGTVNCQCSHVFILSCVDLYHGERFANTDMALAMELYRHQPNESFQVKLQFEVDDIDQVATYDIACEYFINLEQRFKDNFAKLLPMIKRMRWGVPALHVQGHQDSCTYLFGTAYMECVGHFHGETAEQYWPEANQLGPHVRQMNNGHRQDTMIIHHGDWNHKKTMGIAASLAEDIVEAKQKYREKRNHFMALSASFRAHLQQWREISRTTSKKGKEAISVYKHKTTKVPSQEAIYKKMLNDESVFSSTMVSKGKVAQFLEEGLGIEDSQSKLRQLISDREEHDLVSKQKEIKKRTAKIQARILAWRKTQTQLMPKVGDKVAAQSLQAPSVQDEKLFLPSALSVMERQEFDLQSLAAEEAKWREGQAFDHLRALQNVVKTISALRNRKTRDERKQKENTRAGDNIRLATGIRNQHMATYEVARLALTALDVESKFLPLSESDLYMKSVQQKRRVGDSRHTDGALWRLKINTPVEEDIDMDGPHTKHKPVPIKPVADERPEGWLWQLGKLSKMSSAEMEEWSREGDRVQWFRAEAEMQRWQEQGEQKLAELLRTYRSFQRMDETWAALAATSLPAGHQAYARQKAAMYRKRAEEARYLVTAAGYRALLSKEGNILAVVQAERDREARILADAEAIITDE